MEHETITNTPQDVFLHLFNILAFYISVIGFITLYIQYVSAWFPDPLNFYYTAMANGVRWGSSVLLIAVPTYEISAWMLARDLAKEPRKLELWLRKWLIFFTLFISAVTIVVDLITFIYRFLSGEMTTQFFLKILVVLIVAAAVFGYYLWELRRKSLQSKLPKILAWVLAVVVLGSVIAGFFIVGTPAAQRDRRFDEQRIGDLQTLQSQIIYYWAQKQALPDRLEQLEDSVSGFALPRDPQSDSAYEYKIGSALAFELCAVFKTSSQDLGLASERIKSIPPYDSFQQNWSHETGKTCFSRTIDPELYKNKQNMPVPIRPAPAR